MSSTIDAKELFQSDEQVANEWGEIAHSTLTATAITYAMSLYASSNPPPTAERLQGAKEFTQCLIGLSDKPSKPEPFPVKRLAVESEVEKLQQTKHVSQR